MNQPTGPRAFALLGTVWAVLLGWTNRRGWGSLELNGYHMAWLNYLALASILIGILLNPIREYILAPPFLKLVQIPFWGGIFLLLGGFLRARSGGDGGWRFRLPVLRERVTCYSLLLAAIGTYATVGVVVIGIDVLVFDSPRYGNPTLYDVFPITTLTAYGVLSLVLAFTRLQRRAMGAALGTETRHLRPGTETRARHRER